MSRILYYLILLPLSKLPLSALYYLSDLIFLLIYRIAGYRRKVVMQNLRNSFPAKSDIELNRIESAFYRHLCDIIIESIRMVSMSKAEAISRMRLKNPELLESYAGANQSVIIVAGHYNNWELAALALAPQSAHQIIGFYTQFTDRFVEQKLRESRGKFGILLVPTKEVSECFKTHENKLIAPLFGADQSPSNINNAHWVPFLHQETAVAGGTEYYAKKYNYPVLFGKIEKIKRGFYEFELTVLTDIPKDTLHGEISEMHTRHLETIIRQKPEFWLWTHRRWKRKRI
jgi:Kdo2-lipid IVA lauroyltransferase/acyltransferase